LTEDGFGGLFVMDNSRVDGLHGGELLLQPNDVSFNVVVVIIGERTGANSLG
jgi:hypothetical protein